jgi:hypothetical protein
MGRDPVSETILFLNTNSGQIPETKYSLKVLKELSILCVCVCVCGIPETGGEYCRAVLMLHDSPVHGIVLFATFAHHWGLTMYE